jgi:hypothetical protein
VPGVGVAEMVDVGVKNDLVRARLPARLEECERGGTNSSARAEVSRHVCHSSEGSGGCKPKSRRRG